MRSIVLQCDRCGAIETVKNENEAKLGLKLVGVAVEDYNSFANVPVARLYNPQQWCLKCQQAVGLCWSRPTTPGPTVLAPTTEQQLLEAIRNFVQENTQQN